MITDVHAHLFHPSWYPRVFLEALAKNYLTRQMAGGKASDPSVGVQQLYRMLTDHSGDTTIKIMDQAGIDKRVIHILDWGIQLGESEKTIREIHTEILGICRRFPDRLVGFAGIDPRRKDALELVSWAFDSLGARGLKLHPTGGWSLLDPATLVLVQVAADRRLPIMVHVGKTFDVLSDVHSQPDDFISLARKFPTVDFIAGHSGFDSWRIFQKAVDLPKNIYFDVSGWQERVFADGRSIVAEVEDLHRAFSARVFFGTDSPFYTFNWIHAEKQWVKRIALPFSGKWAELDLPD